MITEDLGKRIRKLRQQTGLSQEKFALKIGMHGPDILCLCGGW